MQRERVAFFVGQFELGLRLPLDPFIVYMLTECQAAPIQMVANTVRTLVNFIAICRLLGYELTPVAFCQFFRVNRLQTKTGPKYQTLGFSHNPSQPKLILNYPSKLNNFDNELIFIESRRGWPFLPHTGPLRKVTSPWEPKWNNALIKALEHLTTEKDTEWVVECARLENVKKYYALTGFNVGTIKGVRPLVTFKPERCEPGWVVHQNVPSNTYAKHASPRVSIVATFFIMAL